MIFGDIYIKSLYAASNTNHYGLKFSFKVNLCGSNQVALLAHMNYWNGYLQLLDELLHLLLKLVALATFKHYWSFSEDLVTVLLD